MKLITLISNFFKPSRIKMLGRAGIIYYDGDKTYFVDSEFLLGKQDVVLYSDLVYLKNDKAKKLDEDEKSYVLESVKKELEKKGVTVKIQ